ncbi:UDP-N-acetylmuramoyl-L-alanyl-D-glutamate--2,6-diaminopimelate ligase [Thalassolituus sp. LLYu03]|uniref:UDP-N-acetylmuramoyl-L-alanyl-D-glutamate--2, 6-diaminopimelate ligase n=1 Tax=Thalassolituus sp. LLYu03 TaxID=3421656 RepID=UPI003D28E4F8
MKLSQIVMPELFMPPEWDRDVHHLIIDSRDVQPGDVFIARQGAAAHGAQHITDAVQRGAAAILAEGDAQGFRCEWNDDGDTIPVFISADIKQHLNTWLFRRYPLNSMSLIGVTGTNGKSSVTQYIAQLASACGEACGVLGTLGNGRWPQLAPTRNTTPDLSIILRNLSELTEQSVNLTAMEVSSHGLSQKRVAGIGFSIAVLTNLTQDHLDYHGTMDHYFAAKRALFVDHGVQIALINTDDEYGRRLAADKALTCKVMRYGRNAEADVRYRMTALTGAGIEAELTTPWGTGHLSLPLIGEFNLANASAAIAALAAKGLDFNALCAAASQLQPVAGRMELYTKAGAPMAVIDFAHTPDALSNVIGALKPWDKPLTTVFGCGGDRDRSKRPLMAAVVARESDFAVLTDDNPRTEDPHQIFADVLAGAPELAHEHNRTAAIRQAVTSAGADGIVLIAGKGHENYQDIMGVKHPYSDESVLLSLGYQKAGGAHD